MQVKSSHKEITCLTLSCLGAFDNSFALQIMCDLFSRLQLYPKDLLQSFSAKFYIGMQRQLKKKVRLDKMKINKIQ